MGASSSAINPTQDFLARMGSGRLFEVGASAVKYGNTCIFFFRVLEKYYVGELVDNELPVFQERR